MKKKVVVVIAITIFAIAGIVGVKTANADINPDCPNGCVCGCGGCYCYDWYEFLAEATHPEDGLVTI